MGDPRLIYDVPVTESRYFRYPNLHGDLLTFVADDDVWLAPSGGGRAWRISADRVPAAGPKFSGDGSLVAWTSWRDGPPEIYLASTAGGDAARVSYWSNPGTRLRGWDPAGDILAMTAANQPFQHYTWAYAIPVSEGAGRFAEHRRLPYGPVGDIAIDAASIALLTASYQDPAFWKRYRGGTSGRLWVAGQPEDGSQPSFRRVVAELPGQFYNPMLADGRLAFLSDFEGVGNIYSCALDGGDLRRHTDHDAMYARNASTDGTRIVYQNAGEIWMLADLGPASEPVRLDVTLGAPVAGRATKLISAADHLDGLSCDATGQASAVQVRGTVHWLTHRERPARALSPIPGPVARQPRVLGDTGSVIWVVEVDGSDALEIGPAEGLAPGEEPRRIAAGEIGWVSELAAAPDGGVVAIAARDGRLLVVTVESGEVSEVARSGDGSISDLAFAPDSAWLAWSQPEPGDLRRLRLARLADRQISDITDGRFVDTDPAFTSDGLYLAFLSKRNFDPVYDAHFFDLSFPYGSRPYLLTLAASTPSPFGPLVGGRPVGSGKDDKDEKEDKDAEDGKAKQSAEDPLDADSSEPNRGKGNSKVKPVAVDLDGLSARIVQVPVPESRYSSLRAAQGGLAWLREPLSGNLGEGGAKLDEDHPRPSLEYFEIKRSKCMELADQVNWFDASGDGSRLVIRDGQQLTVVPANRKADPDNSEDRVSVDLARARFLADPAALWRAAYDEAGRAMRHEFWVPDMADVDWDGALAQYRPLLDRIATSDDFADLLHEAVAELGSSHAYIMPGRRLRQHRPGGRAARRRPRAGFGRLAGREDRARGVVRPAGQVATGSAWRTDRRRRRAGGRRRPGRGHHDRSRPAAGRHGGKARRADGQAGRRQQAAPLRRGAPSQRSAAALPRLGGWAAPAGPRAYRRPGRLPACARHGQRRVVGLPPGPARRDGEGGADRRRPREPRRPHLAARRGEAGQAGHRLGHRAARKAAELPCAGPARPGGRGHR